MQSRAGRSGTTQSVQTLRRTAWGGQADGFAPTGPCPPKPHRQPLVRIEIREYIEPAGYRNLGGDLMALDLEMANSFRAEPSVICMVGLEIFDKKRREIRARIATVATRDEERELVLWLLGEVNAFRQEHPGGRLLTFSGLDNDMRWLNERLERLDVRAPENEVLNRVGHCDLKVEFFQRTQNGKISLKKLEEIFGIERVSTVSSRKVSYVLTDVVRKDKGVEAIPERFFAYLREDVHNLLDIFDRWEETPLDQFNLPDTEYHGYVNSIINTVGKFVNNKKNRNGFGKELTPLRVYHRGLQDAMQQTQHEESFENFRLPAFPDLRIRHPDFERIVKKHRFLQSMRIVDEGTGAYRLRRKLFKPKGALAVVRQGRKVLMIRRAAHLKRAAGFWALPGGEVEQGETPTECARRELSEEVGLEGEVIGVLGSSDSYSGVYELVWGELEVKDVSTLRPKYDEVAQIRWVAPEELASLEPLIPGVEESFGRFLGKDWERR